MQTQHIGDQLAGSRMLLEREVRRADVVPTLAVDLLHDGRRLELLDAEPSTTYEELAHAFYHGEFDVEDVVAAHGRARDV